MMALTLNENYDYILIDTSSVDGYLFSSQPQNLLLNGINSKKTLENAINENYTIDNNSLIIETNSTLLNGNWKNNTEDIGEIATMIATSIILGLMILITVIGNVFVIAAIILERHLQNVANYLVASLAVADLFVACLVMPLGAVYEISKGWILGPELCDIWTSCDVLCCTASILHLVAIATDRYWAVTNVDYIHSRTKKRVFTMIFLVWIASVIVSLAPQFGWKDPEYLDRIEQRKCMVSQDIAYQVFATCCTFYVPLLVILVLYWKIYQTARRRIHKRKPKPLYVAGNNNQTMEQIGTKRLRFHLPARFSGPSKTGATSSLGLIDGNSTTTVNLIEDIENATKLQDLVNADTTTVNSVDKGSSSVEIPTVSHLVSHSNTTNGNSSYQKMETTNQQLLNLSKTETKINKFAEDVHTMIEDKAIQITELKLPANDLTSCQGITSPLPEKSNKLSSVPNPQSQVSKRKETLEAKRERKAAKTLAIITGAFVVCWLPFFLMALLLPLCESCHINDSIASLFLWLGYFNSTLNPVIYTIFSPEFRQAFKRILFGGHRPLRYRTGKI